MTQDPAPTPPPRRKSMIDTDHPWFNPLWRRIAVTVFCLGMAGWDLWNGNTLWAMLFGALGLYCVWALILRFQPVPEPPRNPPAP